MWGTSQRVKTGEDIKLNYEMGPGEGSSVMWGGCFSSTFLLTQEVANSCSAAVCVLCFQWCQHPFQLLACQVRILVSGPICWQCPCTKHAQQGYLRTKLRYGGYISFRSWAKNFGDYPRGLVTFLRRTFLFCYANIYLAQLPPYHSNQPSGQNSDCFTRLILGDCQGVNTQCWLYSSPIILARCFVTQCYTELYNVTECHTISQSHSVLCRCTAPRP